MAIDVRYAPDIDLMGQAAYGAGLGEFRQRQGAQRLQRDMQLAEMAQRERLAGADRQARQQSQVFGHFADLDKMGMGASLAGQQRAQDFDQRQFMQDDQQAFLAAQNEQEAKLAAELKIKNLDAEGRQKYDQSQRELEDINGFAWPMGEEDPGRMQALQQWEKRHKDFNADAHQIPETQRPGYRYVSGTTEYVVGPDGKAQKLGEINMTPEQLDAHFATHTKATPEGTWVYGPRGWQPPPPPPKPQAPPKPPVDDAAWKNYLGLADSMLYGAAWTEKKDPKALAEFAKDLIALKPGGQAGETGGYDPATSPNPEWTQQTSQPSGPPLPGTPEAAQAALQALRAFKAEHPPGSPLTPAEQQELIAIRAAALGE